MLTRLKNKGILKVFLILLAFIFSVTIISVAQANNVQPSFTATYTDVFGATVLTTDLQTAFNYNGVSITWYQPAHQVQYITTNAWWLVWYSINGKQTGLSVENPGWENQAWGTAHWSFGIPTPWGTIGVNENVDSQIYYYAYGYWYGQARNSYL